MFWNRRNRHLTEEDLSAYLDAELTPSRVAAVESHLAGCEQCSEQLEGLREVRTLVSRLPQGPAPRSFVLSPEMAGAVPEPPRLSSRRSSFVLAPAAALTVLVALFAVDLTSPSTSSDELGTAAGNQAMVAEDASSAAGASQESARTLDTFSGPPPATGSRQAGQSIAPPDPAAPSAITPPTVQVPMTAPLNPVPSTNPNQGPTVPPPATGGESVPSGTPVPPPPAPSTGGGAGGSSSTPVPQAPSAAGPRTGDPGVITSQAQPSASDSTAGYDDRDSGAKSAIPADDDGTDWLFIGQIVAGAVFVLSTALVFGPGLLKKG